MNQINAIRAGDLDWLKNHHAELQRLLARSKVASANTQPSKLKHSLKMDEISNFEEFHTLVNAALQSSEFEILKWLITDFNPVVHKYEQHSLTCGIASVGNLASIQYLLEETEFLITPELFDAEFFDLAVMFSNFKVMRYATELLIAFEIFDLTAIRSFGLETCLEQVEKLSNAAVAKVKNSQKI